MAQASLQGQLKYSVEYKVSAEKVYDFWSRKQYHIPKLLPDNIQNIELVEGTWEEEGGLLKWTFVKDGKVIGCSNSIAEKLDREKKYFSFKITEGVLLGGNYKCFNLVGQITPKDDGGSVANWSLGYEKLNGNVPDPIEIRDLAIKVNKAIADYLADQE